MHLQSAVTSNESLAAQHFKRNMWLNVMKQSLISMGLSQMD